MLSKEMVFIKEQILQLVESDFSGDIRAEEFDGISVKFDGKNAVIGCKDKVTFARGVFLLAKDYKNGPFEIKQTPRFETLQLYLDVARNGVFTMEALKRWIVNMAAMGFTQISFNFEDMFELEGYPRLGYMRGRYTKNDLKELNAFCEAFGIDVAPSVQSLGHMEQYLQWKEAAPIRDAYDTLLVDEPKTYEFLGKAYAHMRECFPNAKIMNTALDETANLGLGKFLKLHGYEPRMSIYKRHAAKIFKLCEKYNFTPTLSGDQFARAASKTREYLDVTAKMSEDLVKGLPQNMMVSLWDYYDTDKSKYDTFIKEYQKLNRGLILAGAVRTWEGFTEDTILSYDSAVPFLQAAIENNEKTFRCCMFGDFGSETNFMHSIGTMPIYSEYCYRGLDCTKDDIAEVSEFLTKMSFEHRFELSRLHSKFHAGPRFAAKLIYTDFFYNMVNLTYDYEESLADVQHAMKKAEEYMSLNDRHYDYYKYVYYVAKIAAKKMELMHKIRPAYRGGEREYLDTVANKEIPALIEDYRTFIDLFKKDWLRDKKSNGIETILIRLGGDIEQLKLRGGQLNAYLKGEITTITELDEDVIVDDYENWDNKVITITERTRGV